MEKELQRTVVLTLRDNTEKRYSLPEDNDKEKFFWHSDTEPHFTSFYYYKHTIHHFLWFKCWDFKSTCLIVSIRTKLINIIKYE